MQALRLRTARSLAFGARGRLACLQGSPRVGAIATTSSAATGGAGVHAEARDGSEDTSGGNAGRDRSKSRGKAVGTGKAHGEWQEARGRSKGRDRRRRSKSRRGGKDKDLPQARKVKELEEQLKALKKKLPGRVS